MILNQICVSGEITVGSWILYNNEKHEVIRVSEKTVVIKDAEGEKRIAISEIKDSILKYTVKDNNRIYDVYPGSYIIAKDYSNGDYVEGFTQQVKTRASIGMTVRIDDLSTVDKYELYDKSKRYAIISEREGNLFTLNLTAKEKGSIKLNRNKFILVNEKDVKIYCKLLNKR
jgi:hypothetical protein